MLVVGKKTGKIYRLGDELRVQVLRADTQARTVDFLFVDKDDEECENGGEINGD